jgi:hypothetical protein
MNSSAVPERPKRPDDPWTPLEEAMLATALRKAKRRGRRLDAVESAWLEGFTAGQWQCRTDGTSTAAADLRET